MNTTYFKNIIAGNMCHISGAATIPQKYYLGLSGTEPKKDGTGVMEPPTSGTGYTRIEVVNLTGPTDGVLTNSKSFEFPTSLTDWFPAATPATHYTIWDGTGASAHLLSANPLPKSRIIQDSNTFSIPAGEFTWTVI